MVESRSKRRRSSALDLLGKAKKAAKLASLHYVDDGDPGISRRRAGDGFRYFGPTGRPIRTAATLARIRSLVIPPAWTNVWICPAARGHIQATGRDARGRKQYIYHPRWREVRDEAKFAHITLFGSALPCIRRHVRRDLALPGMPRQKVLAPIVCLLEDTHIRVGNDEYARTNGSFGLTTFHNRHVEVRGATIRFRFRGKSGKDHEVGINDPRLARIVRRCQELPGQDLFEFLDEDAHPRSIGSADVNEYLHEITGEHFTAKDFRTWAATLLASHGLELEGFCSSPSRAERTVAAVVKSVAARLGNTASICRKCYIHPAVIAEYLSHASPHGSRNGVHRPGQNNHHSKTKPRKATVPAIEHRPRRSEETALLTFLRRQLKQKTVQP